jgi:FkbM family methyltransferase
MSAKLRVNQRWLPSGLAPWHWRGLRITLEPGSAIVRSIRATGSFEQAEIDVAAALHTALHPGRTILDVGANIGIHSIAWAALAPVIALEPAPSTFQQLQANIAANNLRHRIRALNTAAGNITGTVEFFITKDSAFSSLKDTRRIPIRDTVKVPCTTLDSLDLPPIGLLKIDVEGFERAVIAGAPELLRRDHPVLFIEIYGGTNSNPDPAGTIEDICGYGYEPFVYAHDAGLLPYEKHRDDRYNYFFMPRS